MASAMRVVSLGHLMIGLVRLCSWLHRLIQSLAPGLRPLLNTRSRLSVPVSLRGVGCDQVNLEGRAGSYSSNLRLPVMLAMT